MFDKKPIKSRDDLSMMKHIRQLESMPDKVVKQRTKRALGPNRTHR